MASHNDLDAFEQRLGHQFQDRNLLLQAITHSSARASAGVNWDNERLEFLGDRVLGLVIAELLQEEFPEADEGALARRFNRLVRRETCAEVGKSIDLGAILLLGGGEAGSGGRRKSTIIANACEAVLGAVFQDGGYEAGRRVVRLHWSPGLDGLAELRADAKTALQEWLQGQGISLPVYVNIATTGPDHAPRFTCEVRIDNMAPGLGEGSSKQLAEQEAARTVLIRSGVWTDDENEE